MEGLESTYLEISAEGYRYLVALSWVKEIGQDGAWKETLPVLNWGLLTKERTGRHHFRYGVLLSHETKELGIVVDEIAGVREVDEKSLLELAQPVRNEQNCFIKAAVDLEDGKQLAYVLDMAVLAEYVSIISE